MKTFLTLALCVAVAFCAGAAQAASYTNNTNGNWDVPGNWVNNAVGVSGSDTIIVFQNNSGAVWSSTNNNAGVFVLNGLRVMVPTAKGVHLYPSGGSSLLFTNSSGGILPTITGGAQILYVYSPITLAANLTINHATAGGTIRLYGGIDGTGDITIQGSAPIASYGIINNTGFIINSGSSSDSVTISGAISNNVTDVVQNSATSTLILSGANTFSGGLYIKAGKVELKNIAAAGNAAGTIYLGDAVTDADATLSINVTGSGMNANPISVVSGNAGTATLNFTPGANTGYVNGLITLNNHDLVVTATGNNNQVNGGITGTGNLSFTQVNASLINVAAGTINIIGNVTFSNNGTGTMQISSPGNINNTGTITNNRTSSGDVAISGTIGSNVTAVVQNSTTSTMILSGANTFTCGVQHVAGTLNINSATALGTGPFTISGGTTNDCTAAADVIMTANNAQNWNGDFTFTGTKSLNLGSGSVAMSGSRQVTVSAKTLTVGGSISGIDFGLTKLGAGTLVLSGVNTYSGGTVVNAGTVTVTRAASLPGYATTGNVTVSGTGTLLAKVGVDGWTSTQISNLHASVGAGIGIDISNGNLDYTATSNVTFASITRGTAGTLRLIQDQANRVSVTSALSGLNSASGILPWAIITNTTLGRVDLAVGGAAGGYISALASYQTGAQSTWNSSTNARPSASESQNANNYLLGSLVLDNGINIGAKVLTIANGIILQTGGSSTYTANSGTSPLAWGGSVIDTEGNLIITGVANDSYWGGAGAITKTGPGTLYLGVVNAFNSQQLSMSRDLFINQGLVEYSRNGGNLTQGWNAGGTVYFTGGNFMVHTVNGSDGNGTKNMSLAFMANAIFTLDNASTTFAAGSTTSLGTVATVAHSVTFKPVTVTIAGGAHVNSGTAGLVLGTTNVAIHTVTLNGTPTLNVVNPSAGGTTELTLNGVIGDGGLGYGITKTGNGLLTLSGTNTYTGTNAVNVGTLRTTQASCLSTNSSVSIAAGALMNLDFSGTNTVKALTLGTSPMSPGVYGVGKKGSFYFSGNGALNVTTGPSSPNGTMIRFF